ncbi:MAG: Uma2 family endonuclease [Planctomycetes bacterium]|nr:Uma2 family endonuclease [Planctomycetota bacterium]
MPSNEHEIWIALLGKLIEALAAEMSMPIIDHGMSTFRRDDQEKGLEPDRCYYLLNAPRVRGKLRIDLNIDPPPDLALEIEISRSAEKRLPIYAGLGLPEIWRFDGETITVHQLVANGEYVVAERSRFFPFLPLTELVRFIAMRDKLFDNELTDAFRAWVREQIATGWKNVT